MRKWLGLATLALLVAGGVVAWMGDLDPDVNLSSASEVWADVLRDADQLGLRFTRMSDAREMDLGNRLAGGFNAAGPADRAQETSAVDAPNIDRFIEARRRNLLGVG